jgi:hypothetical protein
MLINHRLTTNLYLYASTGSELGTNILVICRHELVTEISGPDSTASAPRIWSELHLS